MPPVDLCYESMSDDGLSAAGNSAYSSDHGQLGESKPIASSSAMTCYDKVLSGHGDYSQSDHQVKDGEHADKQDAVASHEVAEHQHVRSDSPHQYEPQQDGSMSNTYDPGQDTQTYDETTDGAIRYRAFMAALNALPHVTSEHVYEPSNTMLIETTAVEKMATPTAPPPSRIRAFISTLCKPAIRLVKWWIGEANAEISSMTGDDDSRRSLFTVSPAWLSLEGARLQDGPGPEFVDTRFLYARNA